MINRRIYILISLLLVIAAFALFLWGGTETRFGDFIFSNPATPALLFFVFFAALAGVLKIFVDAALPNRMSRVELGGWERKRAKGKLSYILNAVLFCGLPIIVILAIQLADTELSSYIIRNFIVLGLVLIYGVAAIASALWSYQEKLYLKAKDVEPNTNEGLHE